MIRIAVWFINTDMTHMPMVMIDGKRKRFYKNVTNASLNRLVKFTRSEDSNNFIQWDGWTAHVEKEANNEYV